MKNNSGFTLIELMTTVAIIGILMLMAYPSYDSYVKRVKIMQELVLLQPIIDMQKMEMSMGPPSVNQRSDFIQSMRDQQDNAGQGSGWLVGANNHPTCIGGSQYEQTIVQMTTRPGATWSHPKYLGLSLDPNVSESLYVSGFKNTTGNIFTPASCLAGSHIVKNSSLIYFTQLQLYDKFLSSNHKNFSTSTYNERITIVTIIGGQKKFYGKNGQIVRTTNNSTEMTCAIVPRETLLNPAQYFSKINRSAIPTHCRWAVMSQFLPMNRGVDAELIFMPL